MNLSCKVIQAPPQKALVAARRTSFGPALPKALMSALDEVYAHVSSSGMPKPGHNVAVYRNMEVDLEAGVLVKEGVAPGAGLKVVDIPGGQLAQGIYFGPYENLGEANQALRDWCDRQGLKYGQPCWEEYGDWNDDPAQLRTDIFFPLL